MAFCKYFVQRSLNFLGYAFCDSSATGIQVEQDIGRNKLSGLSVVMIAHLLRTYAAQKTEQVNVLDIWTDYMTLSKLNGDFKILSVVQRID